MRRKVICTLTILSLLFVAVAGCGKPAVNTNESKQDEVQEREDSAGDNEDVDSQEQITDSEEPTADEAGNEEANTPADSEQAGSEAATPSGFTYPNAIQDMLADDMAAKLYGLLKEDAGYTDVQIEQCCACVKESVINGYLKPNGLTAENIKWPTADWGYLDVLITRGEKGENSDTEVVLDEMPDEQMCKLMDSVYEGLMIWESMSEDNSVRKMVPKYFLPALDYSTE